MKVAVMNRSWCIMPSPVIVLMFGLCLMGLALLFRGMRLPIMATGIAILLTALILEIVSTRKRRVDHGIGREWLSLGVIEVGSELIVSDTHDFANRMVARELPAGKYEVEVERFRKRDALYVAAIRIRLQANGAATGLRTFKVVADTGTMFIVSSVPDEAICKSAADAERRILERVEREPVRKVDAEIITVGEASAGVAVLRRDAISRLLSGGAIL